MNLVVPTKINWIIFSAVLAGCTGSPGGGTPDPGPTVTTESCTDNCGDVTNGDDPRELAPGSSVTLSISQGERRVFKVPSGSEVSLISNTGEAELLLFDEIEDIDFDRLYERDNYLCASTWRHKEDNCTATGFDDDLYAVVDALRADATFSITTTNDCSVAAINSWAYRNMQDYYLYADQVPVVNPASYDDTSELIRDLRFQELEPYSYITDAAASGRRYDAGISFGFGQGWKRDEENQVRLTFVYDDSPFGRAGFKRGDIVVSVGGEQFSTITSERYNEIIGDDDNPLPATWVFTDGETGQAKTATVRMGEYLTNTVLETRFYTSPLVEGTVGYIVFSSFLETSRAELDSAINALKANDITDLVLDLRYNNGGRSDVGRRLAGQIGSSELAGAVHSSHNYNNTYTHLNYVDEFFSDSLPSLGLGRLMVLTTDQTASASEALINSLRPYMEVTTIGSRTSGKPYTSRSKRYCGMALNIMETEAYNNSGVSVLGGIEADCFAEDDLTRGFGAGSDGIEGMLDSALRFAFLGACRSQPFAKTDKPKPAPLTYEQRLYGDVF